MSLVIGGEAEALRPVVAIGLNGMVVSHWVVGRLDSRIEMSGFGRDVCT